MGQVVAGISNNLTDRSHRPDHRLELQKLIATLSPPPIAAPLAQCVAHRRCSINSAT